MTASPKRRWLRFSLRSLLIVVTIFGVWLGWELQIVRHRKAERARLEKLGAFFTSDRSEEVTGSLDMYGFNPDQLGKISPSRALLGDTGYVHVGGNLFEKRIGTPRGRHSLRQR